MPFYVQSLCCNFRLGIDRVSCQYGYVYKATLINRLLLWQWSRILTDDEQENCCRWIVCCMLGIRIHVVSRLCVFAYVPLMRIAIVYTKVWAFITLGFFSWHTYLNKAAIAHELTTLEGSIIGMNPWMSHKIGSSSFIDQTWKDR